jgi:hypothetical protein
MTRRPAITLIEALMAIFVMAIGLLALLTLFPLGAMQMGQALQNQRATETANNAVALFKGLQLGNDTTVLQPGIYNGIPFPGTVPAAFQNYNMGALPTISSGSSYPLYVDPYYVANDVGAFPIQQVVGYANGVAGAGGIVSIRRRTVQNPVINNPAGPQLSAARWCTLQDDVSFADNGLPADLGNPAASPAGGPSANPIQREGRYSFAYMLRRLNASNGDLPPDLTVVVYAGRNPQPDPTTNAPIGESPFNGIFRDDRTVDVLINANSVLPSLRRGSWILDGRLDPTAVGVPQGYFYRVTEAVNMGDRMRVQVQSPTGGIVTGPTLTNLFNGNAASATGTVFVMDNVVEVFQKGISY